MDMSVVVPVYGCRAALEELYQRLTAVLSGLVDTYEILLVNDACPQNSWETIEALCKKDPHVIGIELSRNFGQIQAITAGLDHSSGDWVVVMDCDLQDRPEEIPNLYRKAKEGYDAVFARRAQRSDGPFKIAVSKAFYKLYDYVSDGHYDPATCNFSIISRQVADAYCSMRELHRAYVIYIKWLGFRQTEIDVMHDPRKEGKSSYDFRKRLRLAGEILLSQSDKVLRLAVRLGFAMTFLSFLVILALIIYHFTGDVTVGWPSMVASIFLIGGMVISVVGFVGLYVGNIYMQVKERPLYVVRQIRNKQVGE